MKPKSQPRSRDPRKTQGQILVAALKEFSAKGLAGARVDAIARAAGVNKRMLYHYFGSKDGLFSAVLQQKIAEREALIASAPENLAELLSHWFTAACKDPDWFRLLEWEALQAGSGKVVHENLRQAVIGQAVEHIRRCQNEGILPADLEPRHLLLSMMALTAFPLAFPQQTRLVTGYAVTDPVFQEQRRKFLASFAAILQHPPSVAQTSN